MSVNIKKEFGNNRNRKADMSTLVYGKIPPQAPELEEAVLGALLLERDKLEEVLTIINAPEVFYVDANRKIYQAILSLFHSGAPVDLLTVTEQLRKQDDLEIIGGGYYITKLTMNVVSSANVEAHSRVIVEKYMARELIRIAGEIIGSAYEDSNDVFAMVDNAETQIINLLENNMTTEPQLVSAIARDNIMEASERRERNVVYNGPRIGLEKLQRTLICWQPTDLVILGARPSTGKTALALQIALNAATDIDLASPVMFFSLEMSCNQLVNRLQANVSDVTLYDIKRPTQISQENFDKYTGSHKTLSGVQIFIDETAGLTLTEFRAKAKKFHRKHGVKVFIIDYLQLMEGEGNSREQVVSKISRGLKKVAKELGVTVIALSQLNRVSARGAANNVPQMNDLRESGAIEQDADVIMLLHRASDEELKTAPQLRDKTRVDIAKNRNGETDFNIQLHFHKQIQRFTDNGPDDAQTNKPPTGKAPEGFRPVRPEEMPNNQNVDDLPF